MSQIVDLSKLPAPDVLEVLNYESLLNERKEAFIKLYPTAEQAFWRERLSLESEPITKLLEENCYLQLLERDRINAAAKATMLAYATSSDLDILAANFNISRKVIREADLTTTPPTEAILESDDELRMRTQLAFEGLSVGGPRNSYIFHALGAHSDVADVSVHSPKPAYVTITVLSRQGQGQASEEVLKAVETAVNDEDVRPIADRVTIQSATIKPYQIHARLYIYNRPEIEPIKQTAQKNLENYTTANHRLGRDISLSGIYASLHIEGVQKVELLEPTVDLILPNTEASFCTQINLETVQADDY